MSLWGSLEETKGLAGPGAERAGYYPEDEEFLPGFEPAICHYGVVVGL